MAGPGQAEARKPGPDTGRLLLLCQARDLGGGWFRSGATRTEPPFRWQLNLLCHIASLHVSHFSVSILGVDECSPMAVPHSSGPLVSLNETELLGLFLPQCLLFSGQPPVPVVPVSSGTHSLPPSRGNLEPGGAFPIV